MLKTNRSLLVYILLNIVTLGIYSLFFYHGLAQDVNAACQSDGKHTKGLLAYIVFSLLTCGIYALVWHYGVCERIAFGCNRRGVPCSVDGGKFLLWYLLGSMLCGLGPFIALHLMMSNMNTLCSAYNANPNGSVGYGANPVINVNINR